MLYSAAGCSVDWWSSQDQHRLGDECRNVFQVLGRYSAQDPSRHEDGTAPHEEEVYLPELVVALSDEKKSTLALTDLQFHSWMDIQVLVDVYE